MYLVDTNVLAELTKKQPNSGTITFVSARDKLIISVVTLHEISFGIERSSLEKKTKLQIWFEKFLTTGPIILPVETTIAQKSGGLRAISESKGRQLSLADSVIAATAEINQLILVTRNVKDFEFCNIPLLNPFSAD